MKTQPQKTRKPSPLQAMTGERDVALAEVAKLRERQNALRACLVELLSDDIIGIARDEAEMIVDDLREGR